jgi:pyruvate/2-oxoglutarate dehydrogenase complex dihydrolipoamide dehydrogenase (E3) component
LLLTTRSQRNNRGKSRLQTSLHARDEKGGSIYNVFVIGAGTAGLVTAAGTAGLGGRVALIERNLMGGDCLNFGCVPSKALISSARLIQQIRESEKWGLDQQEPQFVFEKVFERMRARRAKIAPHDSRERFESLGVDVFRGEACFVSAREVKVNGQRLHAKNFVIATGSRATIPKIEGIDNVPYFTNETIFDGLREKPESMIVLGGGPIGCELAQTFCRLRTQVTIIQRGEQLLPREDRDVAEFLERRLTNEGVRVIKNVTVQARAVVRNILMPFRFLRQKMDYSVVPWCTYVDPEIAHVGLGEKEAQQKNIDHDLFVVPLEDVDRAVVESEEAGFAKILTQKGSDKVLGATIVAPHAGDLLHEFVLAMKAGIGLAAVASTIHVYPTLAELARKAGDKYNKTRLTPTAKKIFTWLYARARK